MQYIIKSRRPYWLLIFPILFLVLIFGFSGKVGSYSTSQSLSSSIYAYFTGHPLPEKYQYAIDAILLALRKPAHVMLYGLFALSIYICGKRLSTWSIIKLQGWALGLCLACASIDEWHQFVDKSAGRTGLISDVILDFLAAFVILWFYESLSSKYKNYE